MNGESPQLPWNELHRTDATTPWPALRAFAEALVADGQLARKLFEVYDRGYEEVRDHLIYADLYVAAIFALAAPRLDAEQRRQIGLFLIKKMGQAGEDDADVSLEVLLAAAGAMGPAILPDVLDAIASEPNTLGAWSHLWGLIPLVAKSDDEALRHRVIATCVDLLEKVERDEIGPSEGTPAAQTLALLKRTEYLELLQRLNEKPMDCWWIAEYKEALQLLREGHLDYEPLPELWEEPVEKWLPPRCKMVRDWFDKRNTASDLSEEGPEAEQARDWAIGFLLSPVARTLPAGLRHDAYAIAYGLLHNSLTRLGLEPGDWDELALRELLLLIIPEATPADRSLLEKIAPVTEALLYWLGFEGLLDDADTLIASVRGLREYIVAVGMDPQRVGPAQRAMMEARQAGPNVVESGIVDMSTVEQTAESLPEELPDRPAAKAEGPPLPISEYSAKVGRNAPCPCGSGKKYKKCHGRPGAEQTSIK